MKPQTIISPAGEELVVLSKAEYEALLDAADEAAESASDVAIYDARKADLVGSEPLPAEVSMAMLRGDSRLRALRKWRGLKQIDLAQQANLAQGFLSDLENRKRSVTRDVGERLANVLNVKPTWLS